jgi:DNA-binding NtrC family response regulator
MDARTDRITESTSQLIGDSPAIRAIREEIEAAARSDAKVLITGETGVGKDVVARLIHHRSARRLAQFATVNCAGLPDSLLESELFGHMRGSFTGAYRDKPGLLEGAPNGTVFLDEVGEMSQRMQVALLRFLETGELQRVGADRGKVVVNVRLIAATNRDLAVAVAAGQFREDLYYRLDVIRLHVPPLRERREDIAPLCRHFLRLFGTQHRTAPIALTPEAMGRLVAHDWPGNVRQLRNVVERLVLKADSLVIDAQQLPPEVSTPRARTTMPGLPAVDAAGTCDPNLVARMLDGGESFWDVVHAPFMSRDLPRRDVRAVVARGLQETRGNYRMLVSLFNMPPCDYKRFLSFLRKFDCCLSFHSFRTAPVRPRVGEGGEFQQAAGM